MDSFKMKFSGTGVALVTPFDAENEVDYTALSRLVNKVIDGGVNFLVALGTTAETPTLTAEEKKKVLAKIIESAAERVPVVCGLGSNNTQEVLQALQEYDLTKVAGLLIVVPYYNKPTQEGLYQHFKTIAAATDKDIILYNVPGRTVTNMEAATTIRLAKECSNIVAIKESSGNMKQCMELVANAPEGFAILSGDDDLILAQTALGFHGVVSVAANCYTSDFCQMVQAGLNSDFKTARGLHYKLLPFIGYLFEEGNPAGVKAALALQNVCKPDVRLPLIKASERLTDKLKNAK